eukprot:gene27307-32983_t
MSSIQVSDGRQIFLVSNPNPDVGQCLNGSMKSHYVFTIPSLLARDFGGVTYTVLISPGNYNGNSMVLFLQSWFDSNLSILGMQVTLATATGKITLSALSSFTVLSSSTCQSLLGFDAALVSSVSAGREVVTMPYPLDLSGIRCIMIRIPNMSFASYNTLDKVGDCVRSIQVNCPPYGIIQWQNFTGSESIIRSISQTNTLELLLTDASTGRPVDFANLDWTICLEIRKNQNVLPRYDLGRPVFDLGQADASEE